MDFSEKHTKYIGFKCNNMKRGFGIQLWSGGGKSAEGYGLFISEENTYFGQFSNDGSCGFGIYNHYNGASYIGYWTNNTQEQLEDRCRLMNRFIKENTIKERNIGLEYIHGLIMQYRNISAKIIALMVMEYITSPIMG